MRRRLLAVLLGAALLVGTLVAYAQAQVVQVKHFACYSGNETGPTKTWRYLPNGADPCPFGWTKIDWVDD